MTETAPSDVSHSFSLHGKLGHRAEFMFNIGGILVPIKGPLDGTVVGFVRYRPKTGCTRITTKHGSRVHILWVRKKPDFC